MDDISSTTITNLSSVSSVFLPYGTVHPFIRENRYQLDSCLGTSVLLMVLVCLRSPPLRTPLSCVLCLQGIPNLDLIRNTAGEYSGSGTSNTALLIRIMPALASTQAYDDDEILGE